MSYKFRGEFDSNIEWGTTPDFAEVVISDELYERIPTIAKSLKDLGVDSGVIHYCGNYTYLAGNMEDDELEEFEPEYRTEGVHMKVDKYGGVMFTFPCRHTSDVGFIGPMDCESGEKV